MYLWQCTIKYQRSDLSSTYECNLVAKDIDDAVRDAKKYVRQLEQQLEITDFAITSIDRRMVIAQLP